MGTNSDVLRRNAESVSARSGRSSRAGIAARCGAGVGEVTVLPLWQVGSRRL